MGVERSLQDSSREDDAILSGHVVGINCRRSHTPPERGEEGIRRGEDKERIIMWLYSGSNSPVGRFTSLQQFTRHVLYMILKMLRHLTLKTVCWTKRSFLIVSTKQVSIYGSVIVEAQQTRSNKQYSRTCHVNMADCVFVHHWSTWHTKDQVLYEFWWAVTITSYSVIGHSIDQSSCISSLSTKVCEYDQNRHDVSLHHYYWSLLGVFLSWSAITRDEKL